MLTSIIETENSSLWICNFDDMELLSKCVEDIKDELKIKPEIRIFGSIKHQRRDVGFFSDISEGYRYSGQLLKSKSESENIRELKSKVNSILGSNFNGILVNRYNSGEDYISQHSDDEACIDRCGVVSISFGESRTLVIRDKKTKKIEKKIDLISSSMIIMKGDFQKEFTHGIPIEKSKKNVRYSFTFRNHKK